MLIRHLQTIHSIFDNLHGELLPNLLNLSERFFKIDDIMSYCSRETITDFSIRCFSSVESLIRTIWTSIFIWPRTIVTILVSAMVTVVQFVYQLGPIFCIALSWWRLWVRDFGDPSEDNSKANLKPALIIFYALVLLQGAFFLLWKLLDNVADEIIQSVDRRYELCPKWGGNIVTRYLKDTRAKCEREPAPITDSNLIRYALELLDSELPDKFLSGASTLDTLIKRGEDVRSLLLLSRPKIQKLIDTLGWRSNTGRNGEIRELAAGILADLASDMYIAQFPGALQCISSLFQGDEPYCTELPAPDDNLTPENNSIFGDAVSREGRRKAALVKTTQRAHTEGKKSYIRPGKELILQGLKILERLASNQHNCKEICSIHGLIPKIMEPIYSSTLMEDIKILSAWADVVNSSLRVLLKLICAPGRTGRRLRRHVSSNKKAMINFERILDEGSNEVGEELQMQAMEILTNFAMDSYININRSTEENLIKNQLKIFLAEEGLDKPGSMLRITAGRTLVVLTKESKLNCVFIIGEYKNIIDLLTKNLGGKTDIIYRAIAAKILVNLCTYCQVTLDVKILTEILHEGQINNYEQADSKEIKRISVLGDDEDYQLPRLGRRRKSSNLEKCQQTCLKIQQFVWRVLYLAPGGKQKRSDQGQSSNQGNYNADQTGKEQLQEALLSLILLLYDRMIDADGFNSAIQAEGPINGAIIAKLIKAIVAENYQATPNSLRIIKLCCQIAVSMRKCNQYIEHLKDQEFVESLSKAIKITSDLEIYMLFVGTDFGLKKTVRPLLSDLKKKLE